MDPQQRLVLELAWEALEDAGTVPDSIRGDQAGVFLGAIASDYSNLTYREGPDSIGRHTLTGLHRSIIANRVSYTLGLTGPSLTVDAAQSSSLVAVHLACESLRRGESEFALAGGVHLNIDPDVALGAAEFGGLSPDGRCFTFDARANGYVRGEGGGVIALRPLSVAEAAGDRIYCVIRGGAVNNDGPAEGLTVPSRAAQESVLRRAYRRAGLKRTNVQYVELHGTGTAVGDPIEAAALGAALGAGRPSDDPLPVGSAKTNVGHLEGAAGIAGLIKAVLAIERRELPASLNFEQPNPEIPLDALRLRVQDAHGAWPHDDRPLVAGVSSFGMGGTNCHLVVTEAPEAAVVVPPAAGAAGPIPLVLSAKSEPALREAAARLASHLREDPELDPADVAYSLATTRSAFSQRAVALGGDREALLAALAAISAGGEAPALARGIARAEGPPAFLFPGQGSQWEGMALGLLDSSPAFATRLRECEEALAPHIEWSVEDVLRRAEGAPSIERIEIVQPVLFAVMAALTELWRSVGVRPAAVAGHSQGEIAAAYAAGGLSLQDAAMLAAVRSRIISKLAGKGAMVSIALPAKEIGPRIERWGERIEVAAHNGPSSTILSGDREALDELLAQCAEDDVRAREVPATIPSHSAYVDVLREEVLEELAPISPRSGEIPFYSTVTGELFDTAGLDAGYWYRNLRETVRFEGVMRALLAAGHRIFTEISPHPVFALAMGETIEDALPNPEEATVLGTLRRDEGGPERFALSLAEAHAAGAEVEWEALFEGTGAKRVKLPTYPFQRKRYWLETTQRTERGAADVGTEQAGFWAAVDREDLDGLAGMLSVQEEGAASLGAVVPALAAWRRRGRELSVLDDLRYREAWAPVPDGPVSSLSGTWLVAASPEQRDDAGVTAVVEALGNRGARVARVELDPAGDDARGCAGRLLIAAAGVGSAEVRGVISLLGLAERRPGATATSDPLASTVLLLQGLAEADLPAPLWLATTGAVSVSASDAVRNPTQAPLWGLGLTIALEEPQQWGGLVDLPEAIDEPALERFCGVLAGGGEEDQIAVRGDGAFVRRIVRAPIEAAPAGEAWKPRGTILLTGDIAGQAGEVARWLARGGADHLLLAGPVGREADGLAELEAELAEAGTPVTVAACDVADRGQVEALLGSVPKEHPLSAIFHTAPAGGDGAASELSPDRIGAALGPKVEGARNLHELSAGLDLSAFVLFSSSAATLGAAGRAGSAAADAFLDALALHRRALDLPATAIAWGPWALGGAARPGDEQLMRRGVSRLDPQTALAAMQYALDRGEATVTVADFDWERFGPLYEVARPRPLLDGLPEARPSLSEASPGAAGSTGAGALSARLAELAEEERRPFALDLVRGEVAAVLGHDSAEAVDPEKAFKELGFDSLAAVELRNRLQTASGMRLPPTGGLQPPDVFEALADFLCWRGDRVRRRRAGPGPACGQRRRRGADRDRRHGLSLPRWGRFSRGALAARRRGPRRHLGVPHRPRLGPGAPLSPRPRPARHQLRPRGRLPPRRRRVRRRVLRHRPARGAGDGPPAAAAAGGLLGGARGRRHRSRLAARRARPGSSPESAPRTTPGLRSPAGRAGGLSA